MVFEKSHIKALSVIVVLTTFLTWFFYVHETLPKPVRAATALLETPVAIVSGLSHYLQLGVDVYETTWAVILTNLGFSVLVVLLVGKILDKTKSK